MNFCTMLYPFNSEYHIFLANVLYTVRIFQHVLGVWVKISHLMVSYLASSLRLFLKCKEWLTPSLTSLYTSFTFQLERMVQIWSVQCLILTDFQADPTREHQVTSVGYCPLEQAAYHCSSSELHEGGCNHHGPVLKCHCHWGVTVNLEETGDLYHNPIQKKILIPFHVFC